MGRQMLKQPELWDMLQIAHRQFTLPEFNEVLNVSISYYLHHLYLTLPSYIIVSCEALECKTHSSIIYPEVYRQTESTANCCPSFRFSLSLQSGVENYFQLCLSGSTDVCNVFHLLFIISFHILSGFTLKKCYLADVSVCVLAALGWI